MLCDIICIKHYSFVCILLIKLKLANIFTCYKLEEQKSRNKPYRNVCLSFENARRNDFVRFPRENERTVYDETFFSVKCMRQKVGGYLELPYTYFRNKITDAQINSLFAHFTTLLGCTVVPLLADFAPAVHTLGLVLLRFNLILMCTLLIYYVCHRTPADPLVRGRAPIGANLGGVV